TAQIQVYSIKMMGIAGKGTALGFYSSIQTFYCPGIICRTVIASEINNKVFGHLICHAKGAFQAVVVFYFVFFTIYRNNFGTEFSRSCPGPIRISCLYLFAFVKLDTPLPIVEIFFAVFNAILKTQ